MRHVGGYMDEWASGLSECNGERTQGSTCSPELYDHTLRPLQGLRCPLRCHTPLPEQSVPYVHSSVKRP